ncbi:unnamed protein product [Pleuronectes platessa]|uniref:CWH43-like N-terminal domain-containing protein n=1 Tax=Pleuronectes platessa TaxID=8262 RepID=A0A9N7V693_PLEPL|nr:unnamed protein product [Pleuronectes platessa]
MSSHLTNRSTCIGLMQMVYVIQSHYMALPSLVSPIWFIHTLLARVSKSGRQMPFQARGTEGASALKNCEEFYGKRQGESFILVTYALTCDQQCLVDNAKVLHYVGAGVAFPTSMLFVGLQSALTYRLAKTQGEYNVAHLRLCMTLLAFVALVLSGVFFCQESFVLQHASAIFEWLFCSIIMLFYGTFAFEFANLSGDTMAVLARGGALGAAGREHKVDALGAHQPENLSIL